MNAAEEDDSAALAEAVTVSETNVSVPLMTFSTPEAEGEGVISLDQPLDVLEALRSELMREAEASAKREEADSEPAESVLDAEADSEDNDAAAKEAYTREREIKSLCQLAKRLRSRDGTYDSSGGALSNQRALDSCGQSDLCSSRRDRGRVRDRRALRLSNRSSRRRARRSCDRV